MPDDNVTPIRFQIENFVPLNEREQLEKKVILHCIDIFPDVLTRENRICHFTASAWIINQDHTKALAIFHNLAKQWRWPGGHMDGESDLLTVVLKEVQEETSLGNLKILDKNIFSLEVLPVSAHIRKGEVVNSHLHLNASFAFEASEKDGFRIKPDENSAIRWMDFMEITQMVENGKMSDLYLKLIEKTKQLL